MRAHMSTTHQAYGTCALVLQYIAPNGQPGKARSMEDIKERYYSMARKLYIARAGGDAPVSRGAVPAWRAEQ